ncbi:MAG: CvpA family protein [Bryobacteraceae bacterium]
MNWLDLILSIVIFASVAAGLMRGLVRTVVGLGTTAAAVVLAAWLYGSAGSFFLEYVSHKTVAYFLGFGIVFGSVLATGAILGYLLARLMRWAGLGWLDRILGGVIGLGRAWLVCAALVLGMCAFTRNPPPQAVTHSRIAPYVLEVSNVVASVAPAELRAGFRVSYERVKGLWKQVLKQVPATL